MPERIKVNYTIVDKLCDYIYREKYQESENILIKYLEDTLRKYPFKPSYSLWKHMGEYYYLNILINKFNLVYEKKYNLDHDDFIYAHEYLTHRFTDPLLFWTICHGILEYLKWDTKESIKRSELFIMIESYKLKIK